jgi:hypothetical protein
VSTAEKLREYANWSGPVSSNANACMQAAADEIDKLRAALTKIDGVRNSIIGTQACNWSAHIYPLVTALEEAGFEGQGYDEARAEASTLLDQRNRAEEEAAKLRAFKTYVHTRLDEAGVPSDPGGPHSIKGCRIGDRLDIILSGYVPDNDHSDPKETETP